MTDAGFIVPTKRQGWPWLTSWRRAGPDRWIIQLFSGPFVEVRRRRDGWRAVLSRHGATHPIDGGPWPSAAEARSAVERLALTAPDADV